MDFMFTIAEGVTSDILSDNLFKTVVKQVLNDRRRSGKDVTLRKIVDVGRAAAFTPDRHIIMLGDAARLDACVILLNGQPRPEDGKLLRGKPPGIYMLCEQMDDWPDFGDFATDLAAELKKRLNL